MLYIALLIPKSSQLQPVRIGYSPDTPCYDILNNSTATSLGVLRMASNIGPGDQAYLGTTVDSFYMDLCSESICDDYHGYHPGDPYLELCCTCYSSQVD